jgi:hypothetical protein
MGVGLQESKLIQNVFKKKSVLISIIIVFLLFGVGYFFVYSAIGAQKIDMRKLPITVEQKQIIKKYLFPHKFYAQKN